MEAPGTQEHPPEQPEPSQSQQIREITDQLVEMANEMRILKQELRVTREEKRIEVRRNANLRRELAEANVKIAQLKMAKGRKG